MLIVIAGFPGAFIGILFTGALLIEIIFTLDGLGLLGYEAVINRDYPIVFGTLYVFTPDRPAHSDLISDLMYMMVDPRIDFEARDMTDVAGNRADRDRHRAARHARQAADRCGAGEHSRPTAAAIYSAIIFLASVHRQPVRRVHRQRPADPRHAMTARSTSRSSRTIRRRRSAAPSRPTPTITDPYVQQADRREGLDDLAADSVQLRDGGHRTCPARRRARRTASTGSAPTTMRAT